MITDVAGKVRNLTLQPSDCLIPLYEAIVNSIQAANGKAEIEVELLRQRTQGTLDEESDQLQFVDSIKIIDNGVGFNNANFESFRTADSTFKSYLGCKGVGRFTWLKAYEEIKVDSDFYENKELFNRSFVFSIMDDDFSSTKTTPVKELNKKSTTTVTLSKVKSPYLEKMPIFIDEYAKAIIEHCITYFLEGKVSSFILKDNTGNSVDVLNCFREDYSKDIVESEFIAGSHKFKSFCIKSRGRQKVHKIFLCANARAVKQYNPAQFNPSIPNYFFDGDGSRFRYNIYVSSEYLDEYVNQERTNFAISEKESFIDDNNPAIATIITELLIQCDCVFSEFLEPMKCEHKNRINDFIKTQAYEYRTLIKHKPEWLENIRYGIDDNELEIELHKLFRDFEIELKSKAKSIKKSLKENKVLSSGEYKKAYESYTTALNDVGKSNLAKYVLHRKSIIDIFELSLEIKDNDKYALESAVHDIIFPLNATSDDVNGQSQNLWLIDERMSYHNLLASDKPFNKVCDINDKQRPDILIFNNPIAFGDDSKKPSTATIIEFKRPMRDDYDEDENPISQVRNYVKKLRKPDTIKTESGRFIYLNKNVPIYCYIVCDITKSIREVARDNNYIATPDEEGFIWYHSGYNAYFEILSFDKLVEDAKKRNKVLFKTLNIE